MPRHAEYEGVVHSQCQVTQEREICRAQIHSHLAILIRTSSKLRNNHTSQIPLATRSGQSPIKHPFHSIMIDGGKNFMLARKCSKLRAWRVRRPEVETLVSARSQGFNILGR